MFMKVARCKHFIGISITIKYRETIHIRKSTVLRTVENKLAKEALQRAKNINKRNYE